MKKTWILRELSKGELNPGPSTTESADRGVFGFAWKSAPRDDGVSCPPSAEMREK